MPLKPVNEAASREKFASMTFRCSSFFLHNEMIVLFQEATKTLGGVMKKAVIAGSMILALIAGSAFAMGGGSGHGSMHGGQMGESMGQGSVNSGSMDHESGNAGSMDHSSMDGKKMQMDQGGMPQDGRTDQNGAAAGHQHQ